MSSDDGLPFRPNAFARLMLQWERFAPYNAGQVVALDARRVVDDPAFAWRRTVVQLGLQQIGQHPDAQVVVVRGSLEAHVTAEMNRPFAPGESPLRPFVIYEGDALRIGVIYRHVVADSASIRFVIRAWLARLIGVRLGERFVTLDRRDVRLFDPQRRWNLLTQSIGELSRLSRVKRVRRLSPEIDLRRPIAWKSRVLPDGTIDALRVAARSRGASVNDWFVAAAVRACVASLPMEPPGRRNDWGVGTIVDLRSGDDASKRFGLSLGFIQSFLRDGAVASSFDDTLRAATVASKIAKQTHAADASAVRLLAAGWFGDRLNDRSLADFYRKRCPLVAGVSNVNLNRDWPGRVHPRIVRGYERVSPTGPMLPIVFTPTTVGRSLHVGCTYRTGDVPDAAADAILDSFCASLQIVR